MVDGASISIHGSSAGMVALADWGQVELLSKRKESGAQVRQLECLLPVK